MKRFILSVFSITVLLVMASSAFAGTRVYRYADESWFYPKYFYTTNRWPGPAAEFGQNVDVHFQGLTSGTVRIKENKDGTKDVDWHLIRHGTATIYSVATGEVLDSGPFQFEEIGRDNGNDALCLSSDGQHAESGNCLGFFTDLDHLVLHKKIMGNKYYFFRAIITEPGMFCLSDSRGEELGPGCK
jgi:hypothetical protein